MRLNRANPYHFVVVKTISSYIRTIFKFITAVKIFIITLFFYCFILPEAFNFNKHFAYFLESPFIQFVCISEQNFFYKGTLLDRPQKRKVYFFLIKNVT